MRSFVLPAVSCLWVGLAARGEEGYRGSCRAEFAGDSSLHAFAGSVVSRPFTMVLDENDAHDRVANGAVEFDVRAMSTDNRRRDANMYRMFDAETFPVVRAALDDCNLDSASRTGSLPIRLAIRDSEQTVVGHLSNWREEEGRITFTLSFPLSLDLCHLRAPRVLGGLIKVADQVDVAAKVTLMGTRSMATKGATSVPAGDGG